MFPWHQTDAQEFQLNYANIWAGGYQYHENFVIYAGSELESASTKVLMQFTKSGGDSWLMPTLSKQFAASTTGSAY